MLSNSEIPWKIINSVIVAALTVGGIFVSLALPLTPLQWIRGYFDPSAHITIWYIYGVVSWAVFAAVIALIMLALKPRRVALYGLVSVIAFVVTMQTWSLFSQQLFVAAVRESIMAVSIPFFYWLFTRMARARKNRPPSTPLEPEVTA